MLTLTDCGEYVSFYGITGQNIEVIELAREYGFTNVNADEFDVAKALYRARAMDDETELWLEETSDEAIEWLNEQLPPGLAFGWHESSLMLWPDFVWQETEIEGKWAISDVKESYGVTLKPFLSYIEPYGYRLLSKDNDYFWLELV